MKIDVDTKIDFKVLVEENGKATEMLIPAKTKIVGRILSTSRYFYSIKDDSGRIYHRIPLSLLREHY